MSVENGSTSRQKSLSAEQMVQVEALGAVLSLEQVAEYFGMGRTTFYKIMERQPEVSVRYRKGKAKAIGSVAQGLLKQALEGNSTAAIFYLKTQAGWRESNHQESGTEPLPLVDYRADLDELKKIASKKRGRKAKGEGTEDQEGDKTDTESVIEVKPESQKKVKPIPGSKTKDKAKHDKKTDKKPGRKKKEVAAK